MIDVRKYKTIGGTPPQIDAVYTYQHSNTDFMKTRENDNNFINYLKSLSKEDLKKIILQLKNDNVQMG